MESKQYIYNLSKQESTTYIKELLALGDNNLIIPKLLENSFIDNLNSYLKENPQSSIDDIKEKIQEFSKTYIDNKIEYISLIQLLYFVFMRDNFVGPSIYTQYVEETKAPLIINGPLPENVLDGLSNKNEELQDKLIKYFEKDSEQIYVKAQFLILFYALDILLNQSLPQQYENDEDFFIWKARFFLAYDHQLTSSVVHLQDSSILLYESYIEKVRQNSNSIPDKDIAVLLIEQSYCYLNFYKYKQAKSCIKQAMQLLKLNIKLTGKLGRRTKYQQFDIAQLVLDIDNREVQVKEKPQAVSIIDGEIPVSQKVALEEDTILYEEPQITQEAEEKKIAEEIEKRELSIEDQIAIEAYINYVMKTRPKEEVREELLRPYISACIQKSNNWLAFSYALLLRSRNEFDRSKTKERSLLQIQTLIDQYRDKDPSLGEKIAYLPALNYPFHWQLQRELAKSYMSMGVYVSAYELLQQVCLYEDCILAMFMAGRSTLAEKLAQEQLDKTNSPNILCLLGDIKRDKTYYERAWEVSNQKSARAMRSLGRIHYFQGEFDKSIECFEKALSINKLYKDAWFTLGCAYMRIEDFKNAIFSFGTSISIDDSNYEAWSNIANCYMRQDKFKEAVVSLEQAIKQNRKEWRLWENYIILSIETLRFNKAVTASRELLRQDKLDRFNASLLLKICDVFLKCYVAPQNVPKETFNIQKKQLYSLFDDYTAKVAKDYQVYRLIGRIKGILKEDWKEIKDYKLREIRSLMIINWEKEIETCERIERSLEEFLNIYKEHWTKVEETELQFVRITIKAIEECLQRKSKVEINQ